MLRLAGRARPRRASGAAPQPRVSILVVARNEAATIEYCLQLIGGGITYFATDHGREVAQAMLPALEQPTLNTRNITREKIQAQFAVRLHNQASINLKVNSLATAP